ncbi:hypothetical protein Taro_029698 [Colocasia esculenta]|uniref:Uncharacterized protein n=1 Tax=Colocasia esculenta TaxID=4460 RepID=A0A843VPT1_COLES|nr:hypothetical protein [Colocasia esculenta]
MYGRELEASLRATANSWRIASFAISLGGATPPRHDFLGAGLLFVFTRVQLASSCSWWNVARIATSTTSLGSDIQRLWTAHLTIRPAPFVLGFHWDLAWAITWITLAENVMLAGLLVEVAEVAISVVPVVEAVVVVMVGVAAAPPFPIVA